MGQTPRWKTKVMISDTQKVFWEDLESTKEERYVKVYKEAQRFFWDWKGNYL